MWVGFWDTQQTSANLAIATLMTQREPERAETRFTWQLYRVCTTVLYSALSFSKIAFHNVVLLFRNYSCPQLLREKLEYYFWPFLFFFLLELVAVFPQRIDSGSLWTLNSRFFSALFPQPSSPLPKFWSHSANSTFNFFLLALFFLFAWTW